ncbi:NADPH-dependent FMN reductase [Paenibacillus sp. GD4]|uniref:NADPH-dependent FMN reductase n=1 Tax=Paenibacillus sp. GD4 TaxID=3068890 RepID=UPI0027964600|nr:NADPH-dependent FMN reductase [Paenibacillus sp. GD4]MDQ1909796.1 NADPH-dependent FMN reductase [Paenibacillus sp. GD4]
MNIIILAGSNRKAATSTLLSHYIASQLKEKGVTARVFDLYEKPIPFYSPDTESSDANLLEMKEALLRADGIVLATPEYHGSMSGVLKNALDHVGFDYFDGKAVLSVSSAGGAVGVSSLQQLQTIVRNVHGINCPEWISIGGEQRAFNDNGEPADAKTKARVEKTITYFVKLVQTVRH